MSKTLYDAAAKALWIETDTNADTLLTQDFWGEWTEMLKTGSLPTGEPLESVNIVFTDTAGAEYNRSSLEFAHLGVFVGTIENPVKISEDQTFSTREDFGIQ